MRTQLIIPQVLYVSLKISYDYVIKLFHCHDGQPLKKEEPKKAYAKAQTNGELSLKELSTLIASKCTVHQADVSAVLIATTECMLEGLKAGKQVNFGDLGAFRLQINSGGAPSADLFTSDYTRG